MKSFFELRESAKQLSEKTMELAGVTLQNMEHCPGAVSAFKQNLKDGASEADVAKAAKAVDAYLAIEDKAKKSGATEDDLEEMEDLVDKAKEIIDELGLEGHTYHEMHLERVEDIINGEDDDDDEDEMNEAVDPEETGGEAEIEMAMNQVKQMRHYLDGIEKMVKGDGDMEEWVQNKLTKAADYLKSVYGYNTGKPDNMDEAMTASQHRMAMLDKIKKSGVVKQGSMSKNETVDEVLDSPEKMDRYKAKAQYSRDRAAKSAVATNLRSKDKSQREHPAKDLKTMAKRTAGLKMADRAATRKTLDKLRGNK